MGPTVSLLELQTHKITPGTIKKNFCKMIKIFRHTVWPLNRKYVPAPSF